MELKLILGVLEQALKLWNTKESTKYLDRVLKLKEEYYEELDKDEDSRSQLYLDERLRELRTIAEAFISYAPKK